MSITFGSVGDIVAVGQIAWSLAQALNDSKGSAKEYQSLVKELKAFDQALLQVVALWQNYEISPELDQLGAITKDATKDWRETLVAFRVKVDKKYGTSLSIGESGNWVKDAGKKVIWLKEKEDILELRRKLSLASDTITMITLAAMGKSNRLAESTIAFRVQAVLCMLEESKKLAEDHVTQLKLIDDKIEMQSKTSDHILSNVKSGITSLAQVYSMTTDIKNILCLFQSQMSLQQSTPRGLGTSWQQDPVTLEDALGFRIPIPLELIDSWDLLDTIITKRFEKRPGYQKVIKGEYAFEEDLTGRDISRENELVMSLRPGQKIDMSMIFSDRDGDSNRCPRCATISKASKEARTQCASCHMWFQRLVEIDDELEPEILDPTEEPVTIQSGRMKKPKVLVSPADFQRVRLMSIVRLGEPKAKDEPDKAYAKRLEEELRKSSQSNIDEVLKDESEVASDEPDNIPPDSRWTKISRKLVSPEALKAGRERFEEREDCVIVHRVLSRAEVQDYAEYTNRIRRV